MAIDELDVAAIDERGRASAGQLARGADEQVDGDALLSVVADELAVGVGLAGSVLAFPLEEGWREEVVAVLEVLAFAALVEGDE